MQSQIDSTLRPDLARLAGQTELLRGEAEQILSVTTAEQWTWSPGRDVWCVALIVDHLNRVAGLLLPRIEEATDRIRERGWTSDAVPSYGLMERLFIRMLSPNPPFHLPVPSIYAPRIQADRPDESGAALLRGLDRTRACILAANGLDVRRVKVPSPMTAALRLTVGAWLEASVGHNAYHWNQVRALREHPDFPRANR